MAQLDATLKSFLACALYGQTRQAKGRATRAPERVLLALWPSEPRATWVACIRASSTATHLRLAACFLWSGATGFVSISITFFNKAVLASYGFKWPNLMTLFQVSRLDEGTGGERRGHHDTPN